MTRKTGTARSRKRWSAAVTERSDTLQLEDGVFTWKNPRRIAHSLRRSALASRVRKGSAYQSAMSMLSFFINRAGRKLPAARRHVLERAKVELRRVFGRS